MTRRLVLTISLLVVCASLGLTQEKDSRAKARSQMLASAPRKAHDKRNPFEGKPEAVQAGGKLFARYCAECHGADARGGPKAPPLISKSVGFASPGDIFWFLTNGNLWKGMPSWSRLPDAQRWQIIAYLKTLH